MFDGEVGDEPQIGFQRVCSGEGSVGFESRFEEERFHLSFLLVLDKDQNRTTEAQLIDKDKRNLEMGNLTCSTWARRAASRFWSVFSPSGSSETNLPLKKFNPSWAG